MFISRLWAEILQLCNKIRINVTGRRNLAMYSSDCRCIALTALLRWVLHSRFEGEGSKSLISLKMNLINFVMYFVSAGQSKGYLIALTICQLPTPAA